jgi:DNA-directed RNA polymerase specialized sigma24 family protein
MSLPREFLLQIASQYKLSDKQEEAFLAKFTSNSSDIEIAESLHIAESTLRTRMSDVYRKFSIINGKGSGKSG